MDQALVSFEKVAPYLTNPLSLLGFVALLVFVYRPLFRAGIIPPAMQRIVGRIDEARLLYVFGLAVVLIGLGIGLQYYKTHFLVDVDPIIDQLVKESDPAARRDMPGFKHERALIRNQLAEAVEALANMRAQKDAPPGINKAFVLLKKGNPKAAEKIFQAIEDRKTAQGRPATKQAAAAARHIGALAYLHDRRKALKAYTRAARLDWDNMQGRSMHSLLMMRTGVMSRGSVRGWQGR